MGTSIIKLGLHADLKVVEIAHDNAASQELHRRGFISPELVRHVVWYGYCFPTLAMVISMLCKVHCEGFTVVKRLAT